jgi:surface protein
MFYHCRSLLSLDLSSFNTTNVKYMRTMFEGCSLLKKENVKLNKNETNIIQENNEGNSNNINPQFPLEKIIINEEIDKYKNKKLSAREIVRFEPKFTQSIEEMDKETAYYQFLSINSYYERIPNKLFPKGFFNWKDPNLVSKLEAQIKQYNDDAELMNEFVLSKAMDDFHPETMGIYVEILKHDDYIWQLLIYNKFYSLVNEKTIEYIDYIKREEDNSKI